VLIAQGVNRVLTMLTAQGVNRVLTGCYQVDNIVLTGVSRVLVVNRMVTVLTAQGVYTVLTGC